MEIREDSYGEWRWMAEAEGYVMARRPGATPQVFLMREWRNMPLKGAATKRRLFLEAIPVGDVGLSGKALACAERGGFATLHDIDAASDAELLRVPALGRNTLKEFRDAVVNAVLFQR